MIGSWVNWRSKYFRSNFEFIDGTNGGLYFFSKMFYQLIYLNHWWFFISLMSLYPIRFYGSFCNKLYISSLQSLVKLSGITISFCKIFQNMHFLQWETKGGLPTTNSYMRQPNDHRSMLLLYFLFRIISGAMYWGVPQNEFVLFYSFCILDIPKSVNLM